MVSIFNGILIGTTTPGQSGPWSNDIKVALHNPQTPGVESHHQMQFVIPRMRL